MCHIFSAFRYHYEEESEQDKKKQLATSLKFGTIVRHIRTCCIAILASHHGHQVLGDLIIQRISRSTLTDVKLASVLRISPDFTIVRRILVAARPQKLPEPSERPRKGGNRKPEKQICREGENAIKPARPIFGRS